MRNIRVRAATEFEEPAPGCAPHGSSEALAGSDKQADVGDLGLVSTVLGQLLNGVFGATLAGGFYRFHTPQSSERATRACGKLISGFSGRYVSFAFDWLGREVAADIRSGADDREIIVIDPGGGEHLHTDCALSEWHDAVAGAEDPLAHAFYAAWRQANPDDGPLPFDQVAGYKVPLFLGGADEVGNLAVYPREIYFELCTQLRLGARSLPIGTTIDEVIIQ